MILYNVIMCLLNIWTLTSISFWCFVIFTVIMNETSMLEAISINNMLQLILALMFPYIYVIYIMIKYIVRFFRNLFVIFKE